MPQPPPLEMSQSLDEFDRQQRRPAAGPFPQPGPAEDTDPFVEAPLEYFESIGPVKEHIVWNGQRIPVEFNLLDIAQERRLSADIEHLEGPEKLFAERQFRIAEALYSVNGKRVHFSSDYSEDQIERMNWAARFKGTLLFALSSAYERAASKPLELLGVLQSEPKK